MEMPLWVHLLYSQIPLWAIARQGCQLAGGLAVYPPPSTPPIVEGCEEGSAVDETHPEESLLTGPPRWLRGHGYCAIPPSPITVN